MNKSAPLFTALTAAILSIVPSAEAQRTNLSARDALGLVSTQFGPQATQWIAEMRAQGGIPQPSDWQVLAYDQRAPKLLYRFWAGGGRAGDGGVDDLRYPDDVPFGYFGVSQISVDSVAAFTIAEGEARKALSTAAITCCVFANTRPSWSGVLNCSMPRAVSSASSTFPETPGKCSARSGSTAISGHALTGSLSSSTRWPRVARPLQSI